MAYSNDEAYIYLLKLDNEKLNFRSYGSNHQSSKFTIHLTPCLQEVWIEFKGINSTAPKTEQHNSYSQTSEEHDGRNYAHFFIDKYHLQKLAPNLLLILKIDQYSKSEEANGDIAKNEAKSSPGIYAVKFESPHELSKFLEKYKSFEKSSHLHQMDPSTVQPYFQYYSRLSNQMNMLQDNVRTSTYHRAITSNPSDFMGKTVMDIGAGSGILSFFAAQAGASKVYSVEASDISSTIEIIAKKNTYLKDRIMVLAKAIEDISFKDIGIKVDALVSEPIGTFLFNERMIESYLYARDKYLKPNGKMYPNKCVLAIAPFSDHILYNEMINRSHFWNQNNFYNVDISSAHKKSVDETFQQPVVDYIDPSTLVAPHHLETFDLTTIPRSALERIQFDFEFSIIQPTLVHGIAGWFDALFEGTDQFVGFSTCPWSAPTHWYQIRFVFRSPLAVNAQQKLKGSLTMKAHNKQSYNIDIYCEVAGTPFYSRCTNIDLKDPDYRCCSSYNTYMPQQTMIYQSTPVVPHTAQENFEQTQANYIYTSPNSHTLGTNNR